MKIIFDMASVIQTGLRKGEDGEQFQVEHNGKIEKINTAGHGYENAIGYMIWVMEFFHLHPADAIMVFEGKDTKKRRLQIMPTYKAGRDKSAPQYYTEYNKCKEMVKVAFRGVGALALTQSFAEGDDTCAFVAASMEEDCIIVSNDGDLAVLAGKNRKGHNVQVMTGSDLLKLPEGVFQPRHITLYKSLVGDSSDSVPGCAGFGKVAWTELCMKYGDDGLDEIGQAIAANDCDTISKYAIQHKCKLLNKIVDNWNQVRTCWRVVTIYPEWVNTRYYPMQWEPGVVLEKGDDDRLHKFAQVKILVTAANYDEAVGRLAAAVKRYGDQPVAFDIETSTPEESDDWMETQGSPDGVDPVASYLCGFSLTFGPGGRFTYYVSVKHHDTENITMVQARKMLEVVHSQLKPIHNTAFELPVLYNAADEDGTLWRDHWKDAGEFGMLPNIEDTLFMASYVDENAQSKGLKNLSKNVLGYQQVDFNTMRTFPVETEKTVEWEKDSEGNFSFPKLVHTLKSKPYPGGRVVTKIEKEPVLEDGKPAVNASGKPKFATVYQMTRALGPDGTPLTVRKRNPETGLMEDMPKMVKVAQTYQEVVYKMHEMPATAVFDYGADDTICTMAYYRFAKLHMIVDEHFHVYRQVEIDAAYLHAQSFAKGFPISIAELMKQKKEDAQTLADNEAILHEYLISKGWAGTRKPYYSQNIEPAQIKEAYGIVFGLTDGDDDEEEGEEQPEKDPVMSARARLIPKLIALIEDQDRPGAEIFAGYLRKLVEGDEKSFNDYVWKYFTGKPRFTYGNKDMTRLLYDTIGVQVKVRNIPTPSMRAAGIREGNPKADNLAIDYAILELKEKGGKDTELAVLKALKLITMVNTRNGLFYVPYPNFVHWKTGKVHSSHRQCHANTRRASSAKPNMQQISAHEKIEGYEPRIRAVVRPHAPGAVIVSMDFNAQELRLIADDSQDPNMLACYVGDRKKDMHSITGAMIAVKKSDHVKGIVEALREKYETYDEAVYYGFASLSESKDPAEIKIYKEYRGLGKKVNFTALYGAMAEKVAATLMVSEEDAQVFLDARAEAFRVSEAWKAETIVRSAKELGYVKSRLGAKRHLAEMFDSNDRRVSSKADRQAANFRIQGSAAEMTKLAEGRMWRKGLLQKYNSTFLGSIHDEVVASVMIEDLPGFLKDMHECMVEPYADM